MTILRAVARELFAMFVADARLTVGILILVAIVALLFDGLALGVLACGALLLVGAIAVLVEATLRQARSLRRPGD